jgi:hypothetical protein
MRTITAERHGGVAPQARRRLAAVAGSQRPLTLVCSSGAGGVVVVDAHHGARRAGRDAEAEAVAPSTGQNGETWNTLAACSSRPRRAVEQVAVAFAEGVVHLDDDGAQRRRRRGGSTRSSPA